jgi:hypothetical protein
VSLVAAGVYNYGISWEIDVTIGKVLVPDATILCHLVSKLTKLTNLDK